MGKRLERIARDIKEIGKDVKAVGKRLWPVLAPFSLVGALSFSKLNADAGVKPEKQDYSILWEGLPDNNGDGIVDDESDYFDMKVDEFESYLQKTMSPPSSPDSPPPEINKGDMINQYKEPNDRELKYGRGDVNKDGKRDTLDYQLMVDGDISDASDINMDGLFTQADIDLFFAYINGEKDYLPAEFNKLKTPDERKQWYDSALLLDGVDNTIIPRVDDPDVDKRFISGNYSYGTYKAIYGFMKWDTTDNDEHAKYDFIENGKLNGPLYMAVEYDFLGHGHGLNAGWIGDVDSSGDFIDDPTDINNWLRIEPSDNTTRKWSEITFPPDIKFRIYTAKHFNQSETSDMPFPYNTITFESDNTGNISVTENPELITQRPDWISTLPDALPPEITITHPKQDLTYTSHITDLEYIVSDENPDITWYSTDGGSTRHDYSGDSPITGLQSFEGENTWILYHEDWVGHESSDTVRFNVDTTAIDIIPPEITVYDITNPIFSPNGDGVKDTSTIDLEFSEKTNVELTIVDSGKNLINKLYSPNYTVTNPEPKPWDGTYGGSDAVAPDGVYSIKVFLEDPAGNTFTDTSKTITLDTTAPEISITYPESDSTYTSHVTGLEYLVSDANPDSMWFSSDSGLTRTYIQWNSPITDIKSEQGENNWILYTSDKAGNNSSGTVRFNVDTTSTEEPIVPYEYSLKSYPNPVHTSATIKYTLPVSGDVSMILYDIRGRKVRTLVEEIKPIGSHTLNLNTNNLSSGMYIIRLQSGEFNDTEKMTILK